MRFYRYEARDSQGKLIQGTVQALSESAVQKDLTDKGIRLVKIEPLGGGQAPPNQVYPSQPVSGLTAPTSNTPPTNAPPSNTPRPRPAAANVNVYQTPPRPAQSPVINAPQPGRTQQTIHTKAGTDKQRFFIFSQLASAYRAGINAGDVFAQVANRSAEQFGPSLRHASNAAMEGLAVSEVFAQYPDLYPPDVVGLTRAGEAAGFLPDAFDEIGRQAESAHSFKRWFFWIWFLAINTLLSIPLMMVTKGAILRDWNDQNSSGGSHTEASFFLVEMWREFLWPWGPLTLVSYAAVFALNRWFASRSSRNFRHKLGLKFPVYGKRALQENLARFSWTMSRVSRIGMSPARSWELAAASVPNESFRTELQSIGTSLSGQEKMSDIFFRSKLFPDEYAPMIATAEYTGDYSGALDKLAQVSAGEFAAAQNYAKIRSGCWGALFAFVVGAFLIGSILYVVSNQIPHQIMDETDNGT